MSEVDRAAPSYHFERVTPDQWEALAARCIFFGHQSVGENIVAGVAAVLREHPEIPLRVEEVTEPTQILGPGLFHARVGRNGDPLSKADAFARITAQAAIDLAALKFCYVDVSADSDPDELFADYRGRIDDLRTSAPSLEVIHMTMPLTTIEGRLRALINRLRGRTTGYELNVVRHRYNTLLRNAYMGTEPVFDLAGLESTLPDGTRSSFGLGRSEAFALHPAYTTDGGHLNEVGQRRVGKAFLAFLASLE